MDKWIVDGQKNFQRDARIADPMEWQERGDCDGMKWLLLNRYIQDGLASMIW